MEHHTTAKKTRTVTFSNGTVRDANLRIPAQDFTVMDVVNLIRESYLDYAFRPGCGLVSDEVLTSSIGQANFFEGALGGYETRLSPETFALVKETLNSDMAQAVAVARYREPKATLPQVYLRASKNEVLTVETRDHLARFSKILAEKEGAS